MKTLLTTCILASMLMSCVGTDNLNDLANELEKAGDELEAKTNEIAEEALETMEEVSSEIYESEDGRFKINFLGATPTITNEAIPTEVGNIEITMFMYEKSATEVYIISYNDYPSDIIELSSIDDLLAGGKDGVVSSMGITQFDLEEEVSLDGNPGLHFKGVANTFHIEYEMYLVKNRLYQIGILRDGSYAAQDRVDTFLGTFELTD